MAFCMKCGNEIAEDAAFCAKCGTPAGEAAAKKPEKEKVGNIRKCPACGAEVPAMTAVCSECGHEFSNVQASNVIKAFTSEINALDVEIMHEQVNRGWSSWSGGKKIGWVVLNLFTYAIPLILTTLKNVLFPKLPPLTPSEQKKKSLIENFVVPNTREDIMEFVLFSSSKVESQIESAGMSMSGLNVANMWAKVWSDKCKQLSARAGVVLSGDTKTITTINSLMDKPKQLIANVKKKELIKNGIIFGIVLIVGIIITLNITGVTIKVPASATIPADAVSISGDFEGYYKAAGDGFVIKSKDGGTELSVTVEIEAVKSIMPEVEKQIAAFIKSKGWKRNDCSYELRFLWSSDTSIGIGGFKDIYEHGSDFKMQRADIESFFSSLLKMQPGETKKINMPLVSAKSTTTDKKKTLARLMNMENINLNFSIVYDVKNNVTRDSEKVEIN